MTEPGLIDAMTVPPRRFRRYPEYRDSGVEWLGEIPAHWDSLRWRYCCRISSGQVPPDDDRFRERILIAPNHIETGTGRLLFTETAFEQGAISGKFLVRPGDIIYSKIRPALNKVCIASGEWLCSADMYPVEVTSAALEPSFLLYFMLSEPFVRLMVDESMRVAMPKVNRETLATSSVLIPKIEEQRAIAAFLDHETAKIDALIAKKERLIELLQERRTALITRAVTKVLDPGVPMKDSGVESLGEIPAHWEVRRLKYFALAEGSGIQMGPFGSMLRDLTFMDTGFKVYGQENTISGDFKRGSRWLNKSLYLEMKHYRVQPGDIVVTRKGSIGNARIMPENAQDGIIDSDTIRIRVDRSAIAPRFLVLLLHDADYVQDQIRSVRRGAVLSGLNTSTIAGLLIAAPPLEEQNSLLTEIDRVAARLIAVMGRVREAIAHLQELRTALISAAVTGKINVGEEAA